jgi:hypothetical protein
MKAPADETSLTRGTISNSGLFIMFRPLSFHAPQIPKKSKTQVIILPSAKNKKRLEGV